jgi:deoxyribonuclease V
MKINYLHDFNFKTMEDFEKIQRELARKISLKNSFDPQKITRVAGVDSAYWEKGAKTFGVCSVVVVNYKTKKVVKTTDSFGEVEIPYIPGYLAFREAPLFLRAAAKLSFEPDIFMFDGNGYLHEAHMGVATHASFFINRPTIGAAKTYYKIKGAVYREPPDVFGASENIVRNGEIYGRVLRSRVGAGPIFISCGNFVDIETAQSVTLNLVSAASREPIPIRYAHINCNVLAKRCQASLN